MSGYRYNRRRSWKTTSAGVISLIILILNAGLSVIDDDPKTNPDLEAIGIAALAVGTMFARDNDVSSEEAGAK